MPTWEEFKKRKKNTIVQVHEPKKVTQSTSNVKDLTNQTYNPQTNNSMWDRVVAKTNESLNNFQAVNTETSKSKLQKNTLASKVKTNTVKPITNKTLEKIDKGNVEKRISDFAGGIYDVASYGSLGGLTDTIGGILKYMTSESAYQANLGEQKDAKDIALDFMSAIPGLSGRADGIAISLVLDSLRDKTEDNRIKEILNDDQTTWYNKILKIVEDSAIKAKDKVPAVKAMNSLIQLSGKIDNNLDESLLKANEGINKVTDFIDTGIQKELEDASAGVKFGNQAVRSAVGSLSNAFIGTTTGTGMLPMYASTVGNSSSQKVKENETDADWFSKYEETRSSANREGMTEVLWEKLGDGLEALGDARKVAGGAEVTKLDELKNTFIKYVGKKIDNQTTKKLVTKTLSNVLGIGEEIVEEIGTDLTNFAFDKASDENATYTWEDLKNTIFTTIASVGLANTTTRLAGGVSEATKVYNDLTYEEAIEKIDNSDLDESRKNALKFACKLVNNNFQDIKTTEVDEAISLMQEKEKNVETTEKQDTTIENKPLLKQEQQTTLPESKIAENKTSQEIEKNEENPRQIEQNVEKSEQNLTDTTKTGEKNDDKVENKKSKEYVETENKIKEIENEIEELKKVKKEKPIRKQKEVSDEEVSEFLKDEMGLDVDVSKLQEDAKQMYKNMMPQTITIEFGNDEDTDYERIEQLKKEKAKYKRALRKIENRDKLLQKEEGTIQNAKELNEESSPETLLPENAETEKTVPVAQDDTVEIDGEQVEIPTIEAGEKPPKKKVNTLLRILSKPLRKLSKKQKTSTFLATALVDTGAVFENMDLKRGSTDLQSKHQQHITYGKKLNNAIANKRSVKDSKGKEYKCKSLAEIVDEVGENSLEFDDYAKNLLNIDRMSIEDNAKKDIAKNQEILDKIEEYRNGNISFEEIVKIVRGENAKVSDVLTGVYKTEGERLNAQDRAVNKFEKEIQKRNSELSSLKNLPVFDKLVEEVETDKNGKEKKTYRAVTAEESREKVAIYEQLHPEFKEYIQDVYDFLKVNRVEMVNAGVISQESSDYFEKKYPHYIPIDRVLKGGLAVDVKLLDTNAESTIKKAKGGKGEMQPLLTTLANRTNQMYRATTRNELGEEIYKALTELGEINAIEESDITEIDTELDEEMLERETIYEDLLHKAEKNAIPTMTIYRNGKKVTFEINEDIYQALKKSTFGEVFEDTKLSKAIQKTNDVRRKLITEWNPIFAIANGVKDIQDVFLNSQHSLKTYQEIPEAIAQLTSKGVWYQEFMEVYGLDTSYFKDGDFENLDKLNKKGILPEKFSATDILKLPVEAISTVNHVIEMAPRLAEYIASRKMGRTKEQSALDASRVTTNFSAGGNVTKVLNRNGFTFLNTTVQGLNQQVRNVREAKAKGLKGMALLTMKYSIAGVLPVVLSNLIWGDDEEYEELSEYIKDNYYIIGKIDEKDKAKMPDWLKEFVGENNFIRIPKGRAVSATQKIVKEIGQYMTNDKQLSLDNVVNDFFETLGFVWDAVGVANPSENNLFSPIADVLENEAWYGDELVSSRLQKEDIRNRTDSSVDVISNFAGKLLDSNAVTRGVAERLNLNPITINYLIDQYSGAVGDMLLPFLTPAEENNPLLDKFATSSTLKSKYPNEYYTQTTQGKAGEPETLYDRANKSNAKDSDKVQYAYLNSFSEEINELYAEKSEILSSNTNNKQRKVAEVQSKINDLMKEGLDNLDTLELDETNGTATIGGKEYYKAKTKEGSEWKIVEEDDKPNNLSLNNYAKYKNDIYDLTQEKRRKENKETAELNNTEKIKYLANSDFNKSTKKAIYESQIGEDDSVYNNMKAINPMININSYLDYKLQDFSNPDDQNSNIKGKNISGIGKKEKLNYIKNSDFSTIEKLYLRGISYKGELSNAEREALYNYIIETVPFSKQKDVIVGLKDYVELENGGWGRNK